MNKIEKAREVFEVKWIINSLKKEVWKEHCFGKDRKKRYRLWRSISRWEGWLASLERVSY
jgi:hypothetical protein